MKRGLTIWVATYILISVGKQYQQNKESGATKMNDITNIERTEDDMSTMYIVTIKWILALLDKHEKDATAEQKELINQLRREITN